MSSINERTQVRLAGIRAEEPFYKPNTHVTRMLAEKSLALIVGPCATGKSYSINELLALDTRFRQSRTLTSRDPRLDDTPATIRYLPWTDTSINEFCDDAEAGELVQYIFHPKTGEIYATALEDHPGTYNLMPTLSGAVEPLLRLPFQTVDTIGLVTEPSVWQPRFDRQVASPADRAARLAEGIVSIEWMLENPDVAIVSSSDSGISAAQQIHGIMTRGVAWRDEHTAHMLLEHIKSQL